MESADRTEHRLRLRVQAVTFLIFVVVGLVIWRGDVGGGFAILVLAHGPIGWLLGTLVERP